MNMKTMFRLEKKVLISIAASRFPSQPFGEKCAPQLTLSRGRFRAVGCRAFRLDFEEGLGGDRGQAAETSDQDIAGILHAHTDRSDGVDTPRLSIFWCRGSFEVGALRRRAER
jgi:hypothetical protein